VLAERGRSGESEGRRERKSENVLSVRSWQIYVYRGREPQIPFTLFPLFPPLCSHPQPLYNLMYRVISRIL
jgi:hypothetical protein